MISNTPPPEAIRAIEAGLTRVVRRAEIYESDGETLWVPPNGDTRSRLIDGSINVDYSRDERRTLEISLANMDGMLEADGGEGFWYNKIIKPFRGVRYPNPGGTDPYQVWETQMGEFMIDKISEVDSDTQVKASGRDYTKKCLSSKLEHSMSFSPGTYIYALIKALAGSAGISKFKIPFTNETLGSTLDLERGTERWNVMKSAANARNYDIYFDNQGFLTMTKFADPTLNPAIMTFRPGLNMATWDKSVNDSRLYNHIIVHGDREAVEGGAIQMPYFGEAINTDPNSPTSVEQIGDRHYTYASSFFTSNAQCQALAQSWLKVHSLESYEINWSSLYYPHLDVGKTVEVFSPKNGTDTPTKFLLDTLDYPLSLSPMTASGKRVLTTA